MQSNFFRYVLIGGSTATLDLVVFLVFYNLFDLNPTLATVLSTTLGIVTSFILNAFLNFKKKDKLLKRFILFYLVGLVGLIISAVVIFIAHDLLKMDANMAKVISIPLIVVVQFTLNKHFSFSNNPDRDFDRLFAWLNANKYTILVILISAIAFFSTIFLYVAHDDMDNMLAGKLILAGSMPYLDFFSHHAPGMYFISALIYPFTQNDVFMYRLIFNILTFSVLLATFFALKKHTTSYIAVPYLLLMSVGHAVALSNVPLGESLVAQLLPLAVILVFLRKSDDMSQRTLIVISLMLFTIPFVSLAYLFPAGIIYALIGVMLIKRYIYERRTSALLRGAGILLTPYIIAIIVSILSGSHTLVLHDLFEFNSQYYAPMMGEPSGGVLNVVVGILVNNAQQIYEVVRNVFNINYLFQVMLLAGFIYFGIYLWSRGRKIECYALLPLLLFVSPRTNPFNSPALSSGIDLLRNHAAPYFSLALLVGLIGAVSLIVHIARRQFSYRKLVYLAVPSTYCVVVVFTIIQFWVGNINDLFITKSEQNYRTHSQSVGKTDDIILINELTSTSDKYWIGPADFSSQLYLDAQRATRFTFYSPWIDTSPQHRVGFVRGLRVDKPKVIVFSEFFYGSKEYNYSKEVTGLLSQEYFKVSDARLSDYYFYRKDKAEIINKLNRLNYETE